MKKLTAIILSLLMSVTAFAASPAEVFADAVAASTDKTVMIPVKIKNNEGIMGFRIAVEYDDEILTSPKVTKGSITENGMMNDSIGVAPEGSFDVIWSSTQNAVGDGTLMILSFSALKAENTTVKLSYSQSDTFNEAWEDVELKCSDISVVFSADVKQTELNCDHIMPSSPEITHSSEKIKNAVEIAIGEVDKESFESIPEEEKSAFVDRTNEILGMLAGGNGKPFESVEEIKDVYNEAVAEEFVDGAKEAVDSDEIEAAINDSLSSVGAENIDLIPSEKKEAFVMKVEEKLLGYAPDVDKISDKLTADEALEAIAQLQSENSQAATEGKNQPEMQNKIPVLPIAAVLAAAVITVTVVCIKRKKKEETE